MKTAIIINCSNYIRLYAIVT